jgi:membrane protein DedA with SNARE-associated domain
MHRIVEFLLQHGYLVVLGWVFTEQLGIPLPSMPLLLAAGALAGSGQLNVFACLFYAMLGAVAADSIWYHLGRRKGIRILQLLCKISLEPDSCVRRTEGIFSKQGARSLLVAKFIPGLGAVTPPLAGIFHMRPRRFLLFDACGAVLWAGAFLSLGYVFSGEIEHLAEHLGLVGSRLLTVLIVGFSAYISYKVVVRQRFLRELRIARITVEELKEKLDSGEEVVIVDLRHSVDFEADPELIPGALHMEAKDLEGKNDQLPRDREVVLYCT